MTTVKKPRLSASGSAREGDWVNVKGKKKKKIEGKGGTKHLLGLFLKEFALVLWKQRLCRVSVGQKSENGVNT